MMIALKSWRQSVSSSVRACQIQVDAVAAGADQLQMIGETTAGKGYQQFQDEGGAEIDLCWKAMLRMLDRKGISYRV